MFLFNFLVPCVKSTQVGAKPIQSYQRQDLEWQRHERHKSSTLKQLHLFDTLELICIISSLHETSFIRMQIIFLSSKEGFASKLCRPILMTFKFRVNHVFVKENRLNSLITFVDRRAMATFNLFLTVFKQLFT